MITKVEVKNYRCLRDVEVAVGAFQVVVGANASGKTTFLDVLSFLKSMIDDGLSVAIEERTATPVDLFWNRSPATIEINLEARMPSELVDRFKTQPSGYRYDVEFKVSSDLSTPILCRESAWLGYGRGSSFAPLDAVFERMPGHEDEYWPEKGDGSPYYYKLGPSKSLLGNMPDDEERYPVSTWFRGLLTKHLQTIALDSHRLRRASPPGSSGQLLADGSNLPWIIRDLKQKHSERFRAWLKHVAITLPGLADIDVIVREDDRHAYLIAVYEQGLRVPSWLVSDGTLCFLALTILAYLPGEFRLYTIEEPENGIHPTAIEGIYQSLSSVYDGQVFVASHSPIFLSAAEPEQLLCFSRSAEGATEIVRGDSHPALKHWRHQVDLGTVFASGVLG